MTKTIDEVERRIYEATGARHASRALAEELAEAGLLKPDKKPERATSTGKDE